MNHKQSTNKKIDIADFFGANVLMKTSWKNFAETRFPALRKVQAGKAKLTLDVANVVAIKWRTGYFQSATHYTHWFQPLTGRTPRNMTLFFRLNQTAPLSLNFPANNWFRRPDASYFPSGGIRATLKRALYSVGLHFAGILKEDAAGRCHVLYSDRIFSYTGEALDKKHRYCVPWTLFQTSSASA